jgi:hypothetical protein
LTQIECRQACIRSIRQKINSLPHVKENKWIPDNPEAHHHIDAAENSPEHFGFFLQAHGGDPAVTVGSLRLNYEWMTG